MPSPAPTRGPALELDRELLLRAASRASAAMIGRGVDLPRLQRLGLRRAARNRELLARHDRRYALQLPFGRVEDQAASGRCWLFAPMVVARSFAIRHRTFAAVATIPNRRKFRYSPAMRLSAARLPGGLPCVLLLAAGAHAATLPVGPGRVLKTPCAAIAIAQDGDVIEIDPGLYAGDVCRIARSRLTLRGKGGVAHLAAAGKAAEGKAIWVIGGNDTVVEEIEFSGAVVPDKNGAGIRQEGQNLTVRRCLFHDNEDGILAGDKPQSEILIEDSEFRGNGFGDGLSHNLYINHVARLTMRGCWSHTARQGHLVKSRAAVTVLEGNRFTGEDGTSSYEVDLPNAGQAFVIGNLIEQGPNSPNGTILEYGFENPHALNPSRELFVVNNTIINHRPQGAVFINLAGWVATPAVLLDNLWAGPGTFTTQLNARQAGNYQGDPGFVNAAAFDYRLTANAKVIDLGVDPGMGGGRSLEPPRHYVHPATSAPRPRVGKIDIGAFEYGVGVLPDLAGGTIDLAGEVPDLANPPPLGDGAATRDLTIGAPDVATVALDRSGIADLAPSLNPPTPGGCGCVVAGRASTTEPLALALALLWLLAARHRRR